MEVYLDNCATTKCLDQVKDAVAEMMTEEYGNPSSRHTKGVQAERRLKEAREEIARTLKVTEKEIYFTSGGTESDNWALIGAAMANRRAGNHLITTAVEHAAVLQTMAFLEEQGFRVTYLPVDRTGAASLEALKEALCSETILVSMMYVNNEIGTVEPVAEAAKIVREYNPHIVFHVDAVQAYGKYPIYPKKLGIDLLSASGHKIHGPKGVGFLYASEKVKIRPLIFGGGQQRGMRSGTDNVPGAVGLGVAAREACREMEQKTEHMRAVKEQFIEGIREIEGTVIQGQAGQTGADGRAGGAPQIVSVSFCGIRSEVLLHALEERGVYVSSGSACSSNKKRSESTVLKEAGVDRELLDATVRFSFCAYTTREEIAYCLEQLNDIVPVLRKYTRH